MTCVVRLTNRRKPLRRPLSGDRRQQRVAGEVRREVAHHEVAHRRAGLRASPSPGAATARRSAARGAPPAPAARRRRRRAPRRRAARRRGARPAPPRRPATPRATLTSAPSGPSASSTSRDTMPRVAADPGRDHHQPVDVARHRREVGIEADTARTAAALPAVVGDPHLHRLQPPRDLLADPPEPEDPGMRPGQLAGQPEAAASSHAPAAHDRRPPAGCAGRAPSISPSASSATASFSTSGVLVTRTPRALQAAVSMAS